MWFFSAVCVIASKKRQYFAEFSYTSCADLWHILTIDSIHGVCYEIFHLWSNSAKIHSSAKEYLSDCLAYDDSALRVRYLPGMCFSRSNGAFHQPNKFSMLKLKVIRRENCWVLRLTFMMKFKTFKSANPVPENQHRHCRLFSLRGGETTRDGKFFRGRESAHLNSFLLCGLLVCTFAYQTMTGIGSYLSYLGTPPLSFSHEIGERFFPLSHRQKNGEAKQADSVGNAISLLVVGAVYLLRTYKGLS